MTVPRDEIVILLDRRSFFDQGRQIREEDFGREKAYEDAKMEKRLSTEGTESTEKMQSTK